MKTKTLWKSCLAIVPMLVVAAGCSSFNRDWKNAATVSPRGIAGRWEGTWSSDQNGHSGKLRCLLEPISEQRYRARFDSTYKKVLHFKSTVVLEGISTNEIFQFKGEAKLPWWAGGIYDYAGTASETNFFSTYRCKYDHGTFQMTRED